MRLRRRGQGKEKEQKGKKGKKKELRRNENLLHHSAPAMNICKPIGLDAE